ncbi:MAG: carbon-nitrogen hydrolase family protein [Bdellovibrionales bacterium]
MGTFYKVLSFSITFILSSYALAQEQMEPQGTFPPAEYVKVATIAFTPPGNAPVDTTQAEVNRYKVATAAALEAQIRAAAKGGAKLIVTPEFGTVGYPDIPELPDEEDEFQNREQIKPYVETVDGTTARKFGALANQLNVWLVVGIAEVAPTTNRYYNTILAINPQGQMVQSYRKIQLFEGEKNFLSAGSKRVFFTTEWGKVGLFTCYDIHFAHPATDLVTQDGVSVIAFPTSWVGRGGMSTFRQFALSNKVYFLAANHTYFPDSGVVSPNGRAQSHIRTAGIAYGYIKKTEWK